VAQFDVHRNSFGEGLLLDCQSDLLSHLTPRLVTPLLPASDVPAPLPRLNPVFEVNGAAYMMVTDYAGAIDARDLGPVVASLVERDREIMNALDLLISGV
jgi:toxin CcdB